MQFSTPAAPAVVTAAVDVRPEPDGTILVAVRGEIDMANAAHLRRTFGAVLAEGASRLEIDLGDLGFIDSSGLSVLVGAERRARASGVGFAVRNVRPGLERVFAVTGLDRLLERC